MLLRQIDVSHNKMGMDIVPKGNFHTHVNRQSDVLGWVRGRKYIYHDILCDKVIPKKIPFWKKNINKCKKLNVCTSVFHFITVATWEVLILDRFLNSAFVFSPRKKASTSHFYSSQHVLNEREKTKSYRHAVLGIM